MNRPTLYLLAAATAFGCWPAAARADRASFSIQTDGVAVSVHAGDEPGERASADDAEPVGVIPDGDVDPFIPDVYPSREEAARAIAGRWAATNTLRRRETPARVRLMCEDAALFGPVLTGIRSRLTNVAVEPCDGTVCGGGSPPAGEAWLYVTVPAGAVSIRSAGASGSAATARFVDKPWISNFAAFAARTPGRWVVAHSNHDRPVTSAADAARDARLAAADEVLPLVTARLRDADRVDHGHARRFVEGRLLGDRLVHDRFPQKYERPYGTLFREAVLVDASDARLDSMARDLGRSLESERRARAGGFASAAAVLLVTYALYRFANAFTRGYFTWSLRTAAAVVAAGAVTLIAAVA